MNEVTEFTNSNESNILDTMNERIASQLIPVTTLDITKIQLKTVQKIIKEIYRYHGTIGKSEFKQIKMDTFNDSFKGFFLLIELGDINDEGTLKEIFCRDRRHFHIGVRGGINLLNTNKKTKCIGIRKSIRQLTN